MSVPKVTDNEVEGWLDSLVKKGYATVDIIDGRKCYGLTEKGRKEADKIKRKK